MEELSWIHSNSPRFLLDVLKKRLTPRKMRLCACGVLRRVFGRIDRCCQEAAEVAELVVEGRAGRREIKDARRATTNAVEEAKKRVREDEANHDLHWYYLDCKIESLPVVRVARVIELVLNARDIDAASLESVARTAKEFASSTAGRESLAAHDEEIAQCNLVRCTFGNPFRPVAFSPEWRSDTALSLAKHIYESRDFSAMPILADALQDAGCENADILTHCRDESLTHIRGCWVVDLVLGKERVGDSGCRSVRSEYCFRSERKP